ncbi:MAG: DUF2442 domain-containing protein [Planctomycetaceae bacterium]|jgi:hypothetical protein|nr:DUF2442 domain-containing protein [Planctomycetaceae bacterium]
MKTIAITQAKYLGKYEIHFIFSDKTERTIDFSVFLNRSNNPVSRKFLNKKLFQNFQIEYGDIIWNNYELCFPVWDLYEGDIC